jgi:amino acid adenylation domain-containing protein
VYVEQLSCALSGELDLDAFERAWRQTVERHPILRTAFVWEGLEEPVQVVRRSVRLPFAQEDWRELSPSEQVERLRAYLKSDLRQGFDLSKAPLMRLALLRLSADTYQFVWTYHHLMLDGWCIPLVLREVFAFYEAFSRGQSIAPERPRPYRDYIAWLRRQDLKKAESFWRQTLEGFRAPTPLPAAQALDRNGDDVALPEEYCEQEISVPAEITAALQSLARRHGLTLNTLVQGAWALLLARYSGEPDVLFGVTVAGRPANLAGVEAMVGLFINTLPLRVKVDGEQELLAWLKELQEQQTELRQYEYSPLVQVQGWSDVPRGLPLFESLLVFENYPVDASFRQQLAQLSVSNIRKVERTNYPLTLLAVPGAELLLRFSYDSRRFDAQTVKRMLGHLQSALESFAAAPSQQLAAVSLLTPAERRQLLFEWNNTRRDYPQHACLHELFEAQVERTPDAVALVFEDEHVTYRELNRRANSLAQRLRASGVRVETRVGVCAERSMEMVIALFGVLKAGGAYVPLEPTYPAARLSYMLADSQVSVLLTQEHLLATLPPQHGAAVICLDRDLKEFDGDDAENVPCGATPQNAAYVIYTSGSTGQPKGVVNTHGGICNRLLWMQDEYKLTCDDRVLQKTPFSFDVSVWEFFWPLMTGARLVVARPGGHQDSAYLVRLIERERITTLHFVPSMLAVFLHEPGLAECRSLRRVICSGEALTKELQERFYARLHAGLHNLYGPTEAAVDVSHWACERDSRRFAVPIGRPIANTQLYVLDAKLQPVPSGVAGELYIAGAGLARGYLNRPELTAEKFIPDPFGAAAGARLYRTGDAARFLEGGEIEFLGRLDDQVKLRGFRIELGEIEAVLAAHEAINECAVVVRDDPRGKRRIVAYCVPAGETLPASDALRSFLKEKLPEYMIPSAFVALHTLPLTPNGKLDRRALPAPEQTKATGDAREDAASGPLEELVAGIWAEVLGLEQVSASANFFESGGHSLLALQVVSRLRSALNIEVPVRELFDAPTVAGFAESIANLRHAELGLPSPPPLRAVSRDRELPPSFAQQRLWFLDQLEPGSTAYNIPVAIRLRGALDVRALEASFNEVLRRHEALRTGFATVCGQAVQRIAPELRLELSPEDLRGAYARREDGAARDALIESIAEEEAGRAFDLENAPLLRLRLLRVEDDEHVLVLVMHHIISDGWSIGILIREVAALYEAFSNERTSPLKELTVQYADFAVWQREWLQGEALDRQLAYWKRQLEGGAQRLQLPAMREQPARTPEPRAFRGARQQFALPLELSDSLKRLSRREGATLFMTLLAAFQTLLQRYTGDEEISVGSPVANRNHERIEDLIGFFINTLVLRTTFEGDPSFNELLKRVREVCLGAYAHQDVPFEKLVEELQPEREMSHAPLFQVMFVLQNAPMPALALPGLTLDALPIARHVAKFDLTLSLEETSDGLKGLFEYNEDLFDEAGIGRLIARFRNLLEAVASDPAQRLSELRLLDDGERRQLLAEWNDTNVEYERDSCLHELFERQVERTPEAAAVSFVEADGRVSILTYSELNARANRLARHLVRLGVGAETFVGILAAREPETVVGVLAVLKAGGAYLPLDPAYPKERIGYMLADARVRTLLTQQRHAEILHAHDGAQLVYLDAAGAAWAEESAENLPRRARPENLAYVIYTSGSTGQPKGVMVSHQGLSNLSLAEASAFDLKAGSRVLQFASWSFDASVFEMVAALTTGATLCLAGAALPGEAFTRFLREQSINVIGLTPTTLAAVPATELPDLQVVITGGEPCPPELVARWAEGRRFFNVYGPTETTTTATFGACTGDGRTPSIGRPIANTQIYILDERLQPVPVGVVGQLHIGGVALSRGYLNRPELTAEKFIPNPFGGAAGARLYRTGDAARYREGGEIEFVGRVDRQVKLRGFRIEPGEIEAALAAHSAVRECAVVVREDARGERRIVAYATLYDDTGAPQAAVWRAFLKGKLPDYMIPSAFVVLDAMPLTPGGKLDRRALPAPEPGTVDACEGFAHARTPAEEVLSGIWAEVLGLEQVSASGNFFESGGHSLLATQLVSRVREVFQVELPLRDFFDAPTLGEVAVRIESLRRAQQGLQLTPIKPVSREADLPLSFAQQRLWFLDEFEPGNSFYNVPSAIRLVGALDVHALEHSLNEVIRRHEILRTTFESAQGQPRQVIARALTLSLTPENLQDLNGAERRAEEVRRLAVEEAQRSFDLAQGPLVRARLLQVADEEHVLLFTMHHIVSDGWSVNVLLGEVAALYEAYRRGEPSPLPELSIQYADFAAWQREWLDGEQLETQLRYWREQLRDAPALLELPTDRTRPPVQTYSGATARFELPKSLSDSLQRLSRSVGATLFMTLLAAFQTLLQRYSGAADVLVGTPIAGRNRAEIEGLIGFFVNTLVLRTKFDGDPSFNELLRRVREVCLGAYAHQDVPFEKLVEELQPEREMSHAPLFQVMFSLQNAWAGQAQLAGLEMRPLEVESGVAKFDLTLGMNETAEGLAGLIEYNTDLFEAETIERMIGHLTTLLEGIVADPERSVSRLSLMTGEERRRVVGVWNETRREYARRGECVHEMFERQASARPEASALVCGEKEWTFAEVNARANRLARYLRKRGVGAETLVGVMLERSAEMLIGWLGVLKAGGAYLPLDPAYPKERLAFMLQDARVELLLTADRLLETTFEHKARVVCVDAEREAVALESVENLSREASPGNLAYVIYTSGSTGVPKGVCVPHGALANHARAVGEHYGLQAADRVLQFASMSFDVAAEELFASWAHGATVVLMPPDDYLLQTFVKIIEDRHVSVVNLPASYWYEWVAALSRGDAALPPRLRLLVTGSEKVSTAQLAAWHELAGERVRWINAYGPTEATITTTIFEPRGELKYQGVGSVPIGRPVNNARVYLLDGKLQPLPVGIAGELHIGGAGLARGYLGRPELTAEKFIPDPFSAEAGARLYGTGDWARYLPDGNIEFLRRIDQQVKVRGFRIELGEIESVIAGRAGVHEAAVLVREDAPGEERIVAYVVPKREGDAEASRPDPSGAHELTAEKLRAHLSERVPVYMLPSAFVLLDEMPLTPSGKLDTRALPAPEASGLEMSESFAVPRSPVEEVLAGIFGEVLKRERVGVNDNFFALGGHSLLATQVVARAREVFRVELPLRALFESPTVAGLAAQVEALDGAAQTATAPPLRPVPRDVELPLSFIQQRFWFLHQLMPESSAYNIPTAVRLSGALDVPALERSFNEIVRRHEILRTTFADAGGRPQQVIADELKLELPLIDLSGRLPREREAGARRLAAEEAQKPFDLARGPLIRTALLRLDAHEFVLLFTMHHIVSDGWSAGVLIRDLTAIYEAYAAGLPSPLPELPIQFADFAHWQREWLQGEALEHRLSYWRKQFGDRMPVLNLPTDRPRPPVPTDHGAIQTLVLPAHLRAAIESLGQRESVTLFMTLLAAFKVLLHRYTGQEDILVGSSIANRNHVETEGLIGLLINTLVLRTDLSGDPSFEELLARVREASLGAYAHQDLPFEQLLEELRADLDASAGNAPVFQVAFQLQNFSMPTLELKNLTLSPFDVEGQTAKFDLSLSVIESPGELLASLEYNTDLFEAATIKRLLEHYRNLLEGVVANPSRRISALPLLGEAERLQLLSEWNPAFERDAHAAPLHRLFERQAERRPDAVAVVFEDQLLTYGELNRRANQLAHYLRRRGVRADALVAICVERSIEMLVGILGILKAGGAYVPLDPAYPKERLAFILADTQARLLLTQQSLRETLPEHDANVLLLDADWPAIAATSSDENPQHSSDADSLAYVIYTSGSTGQPKGVLVSHENVARLLEASQAHFNFDARDVWTLFHSYAFDFSVWEIWGALAHGGKLVVVPYWISRSAEAFHRLLASEQVTVLNQTPSAFRQLMAADEFAGQDVELKLRLIIFGGEALELQSLRPWFARHGDRKPQLVNMFGITETTVHVTYRLLTASDLELASSSVIGRPLACLQVYLLDGRGQPVPVGVPAEICVGGTGLARGYLNRAELTAERFVPHPYVAAAGARLYRSGDLARFLPDGDIEYLGRIDNQVKVRGFRIELGEIEAALAEHEGVRECIVVATDDANGETKLLAYLVGGQQQPAPGVSALREFLQEKLPEHMIPAAFIVLDAMPLTPNGKIDRRALPALDQSRPQLGKEFVAPRTPVERELANIWRELLGVEEVGIHDDFFELGGHSLLLTQLASWIRRDFQVEVPLRVLFDTPTITDMTKAILARQVERESRTDLAEMLSQLKQLSPHEVKAMLEKMGGSR